MPNISTVVKSLDCLQFTYTCTSIQKLIFKLISYAFKIGLILRYDHPNGLHV